MNGDLIRDPVDDLCDAVARMHIRPADAALIYRALCDYRANNTHTHMALCAFRDLPTFGRASKARAHRPPAATDCDSKGASVESLTTHWGAVGGKQ